MEGIETITTSDPTTSGGVSRCPDMEGIETATSMAACSDPNTVSVGAPTWRGLKLQ